MRSFKTNQWRILISLAVVVVHFASAPPVHAGECSWWDTASLGISCVVKLAVKRVGESEGRGLIEGVKPEFDKMVDQAGQQLADHVTNSVDWSKIGQQLGQGASQEVLKALKSINWQQYGQQVGAGLRQEFEGAMNKLFNQQLKPLLKDIDMLLKGRIEQADKAAEARINQLDELIDNKLTTLKGQIEQADKAAEARLNQLDELIDNKLTTLKGQIEQADKAAEARLNQLNKLIDNKLTKVDALIQDTFAQFRQTADETIAKVKQDIIDYAVERFKTSRDETVAQIRAEVIDYAANTFKKTADETVAKVKAELIDHTVTQLGKLRGQLRQEVDYFFDRAENLIVLLDCTAEKIRLDLERTREQLDRLGEKYLKEFKASIPQVSKLLSFGAQPKKPPTESTATDGGVCYEQLGISAESLEGFEYSTIYDIKKCKVLNTLTVETPLRRVLNVYWDLHIFAKRVACIQQNPNHFMWDWLTFEYLYDFWSLYQYE
ncbi:MAG: hypothetical protein DRR08_33675 [Candidatus Parabeggiatoa sp. nov. 2]|nr:MAG: hypothetical protein B6247_10495 [Beggiatoa sp. 4572_84]RKZ46011.1 MAG: hypothetical protein DRR08_33675 [Gammaproteobacteria bacterium]